MTEKSKTPPVNTRAINMRAVHKNLLHYDVEDPGNRHHVTYVSPRYLPNGHNY